LLIRLNIENRVLFWTQVNVFFVNFYFSGNLIFGSMYVGCKVVVGIKKHYKLILPSKCNTKNFITFIFIVVLF